jgi:rhamnulokinase
LSVRAHIAIDVGASSGRVIRVAFGETGPVMEEVHRFANEPKRLRVGGSERWCWDIDALFENLISGLSRVRGEVHSIGIATWGCDYGLVDDGGALVAPVTAYRDERHQAAFERVRSDLGARHLYATTGIQFQPFNTLYQLATDAEDPDRPLERADRLLMIPDLLARRLCGSSSGERTNASTTQCFDGAGDRWIDELLSSVGVPLSLMPPVVAGGAREPIGVLLPEVSRATGLPASLPVHATATHDTAAAVAATPLQSDGDAYISSGTWSLVGVELEEVIATDEARRCNFTNEAGVFGTTRFLKNVSGLWLLQQCRAAWRSQGRTVEWTELVAAAEAAPAFASLIDPDHPAYATPGDMPERIRSACRQTREPVPETDGALARCILDSLALRYATCIDEIESVTGRDIDHIVVVGGGSRNGLLNRLTADTSGRPVSVGPAEATALGNALVQNAAVEGVSDLGDLRSRSCIGSRIEPDHDRISRDACEHARARFRRIVDNDRAQDPLEKS